MKAIHCLLLVVFAASGAFAAVDRFSQVWSAKDGEVVDLFGVVTHVFPDPQEGFVLVNNARYELGGVRVKSADGAAEIDGAHALSVGETVVVHGTIARDTQGIAIRSPRVMRTGRMEMAAPANLKISDFRKGLLHLRRIRVEGWVATCTDEPREDGKVDSVMWLRVPGTRPSVAVIVRGGLSGKAAQPGAIVAATGIVMNEFNADGRFIAAHVETQTADVQLVQSLPTDWWRIAAVATGAMLAMVAIVFFVMWLCLLRRARDAAVVAAERQRMATELHDTVEQHFAAARLLVVGALHTKGVPDKALALLKQAAATMANAKLEVRDAVTNLRAMDGAPRSLADGIAEIAAGIGASGAVRVHVRLSGVRDRPLKAAVRADVLAIVREAVTNAIKHGKAKTIAIVADMKVTGDGGRESGFALSVLNDGEKFDADCALGPETGHFGLSGMKERAARSHVGLSFVSSDKWCGVKLEVGS